MILTVVKAIKIENEKPTNQKGRSEGQREEGAQVRERERHLPQLKLMAPISSK